MTIRMHKRPAQRRGLSIMMVLGTLIFIAAAVAMITVLFTHELRRTRAAAANTQLQQLLLAAMPVAQEELAAHGGGTRTVQVSIPVEGATLQVEITMEGDGVAASALAGYRGFQAGQVMHFAHNAMGRWVLSDAQLTKTLGQ